MDNGLIFPYPCCCANAELGDAKRRKSGEIFGYELMERANLTDSRQAMG